MKKLTIIIIGLALFCSTAFAGEGDKKNPFEITSSNKLLKVTSANVSKEVTKAFSTRFNGAENVNWKQQSQFYFADFQLKDHEMSAAYNEEGELLGISRTLKLTQLPLHVEASINETFIDYKITTPITEIVFEGETAYYFQAENNKRSLKVKCNSQGHTEVLKRTKRKLVGSVY